MTLSGVDLKAHLNEATKSVYLMQDHGVYMIHETTGLNLYFALLTQRPMMYGKVA
jgi:hypothetical protein